MPCFKRVWNQIFVGHCAKEQNYFLFQIYVGGLGNNVSKYELEDIFNRYGKLKNVWVARNPPGFAFVEFEDERDAEDAVKALDGTRICGNRAVVRCIRTELSNI